MKKLLLVLSITTSSILAQEFDFGGTSSISHTSQKYKESSFLKNHIYDFEIRRGMTCLDGKVNVRVYSQSVAYKTTCSNHRSKRKVKFISKYGQSTISGFKLIRIKSKRR